MGEESASDAPVFVAPRDVERCVPWRIGPTDAPKGARIGGCAPDGLRTSSLPRDAMYFGTFPLAREPRLELSVFVRPFDQLVSAMNEGLMQHDHAVCFVHAPTSRGSSSEHRSQLTPLAVRVGRWRNDLDTDGNGREVFYSDHKIGGRPYCIQEPELEGAAALLRRGFVHALQVDFPGSKDGPVAGSWPFGDGMFNVFVRPPFGSKDMWWALQG